MLRTYLRCCQTCPLRPALSKSREIGRFGQQHLPLGDGENRRCFAEFATIYASKYTSNKAKGIVNWSPVKNEDPAVLQALFGASAPTLDSVFDGLADFVELHFEAAFLDGLIA